MGARPLVIRVEEIATGAAWVYLFESGPVWIGSNSGATLSISRPFILENHGIIQFDERGVRYQDLDARSGTVIDGVAAGNGENPLTEWSRLEMGPVRLTISRKLPEEPVSDPAASPFAGAGVSTLVLPTREDVPLAAPPSWAPPPPRREPARDALLHSDEFEQELPSPRASRSTAQVKKKPRRRTRSRFSVLAWVAAFALFVGIVGVAGLMLQFQGLPWMPAGMAARIPPWLASLFR